ncbi:MAG: FecR domain-containing protein, partial [Terriglobales bacterium]
MTKRGLLLWVMAATLLSTAVPTWAAPAAKPTGPKAGNITALLPVAHIVRGSGKQAVTSDAKKGDDLVWNDLIKTEKGGRARVTLADQSILSLGSQAELRIVKHDVKSQQTTLQMAYGRVRAQVASITRNGGSFELRTP